MAVYRKRLGKVTFANDKLEGVDLGNTDFLKAVHLEFNGTLTAAGGAADATLVEDGLLKTAFQTILIEADGSEPVYNSRGYLDYYRRAIQSGSPGVLVSVIPTGAAATSQRAHVVLDMDSLQTAGRFAGRVPAKKLGSLVLWLQMGNVESHMVTGGDRTETMTGIIEVVGVFDDSEAGYKGGSRKVSRNRFSVTAATDQARLPLPSGQIISGILLYCVDNSVKNNAILDIIKVLVGEKQAKVNTSFEDIASDNVEFYGLELSSGAPPYTGVIFINFDVDGDMDPEKMLDTRGLKENAARLEMTVGAPTGTAFIDIAVIAVDHRGVGAGKGR